MQTSTEAPGAHYDVTHINVGCTVGLLGRWQAQSSMVVRSLLPFEWVSSDWSLILVPLTPDQLTTPNAVSQLSIRLKKRHKVLKYLAGQAASLKKMDKWRFRH